MNQYLMLFLHFCKFSVLCFGGGYMLIPLLTEEFVGPGKVLSESAFGNLVSVAQVTPGPVGLNTATYVGYVNGGFFGSLAASLGLVYVWWQSRRLKNAVENAPSVESDPASAEPVQPSENGGDGK